VIVQENARKKVFLAFLFMKLLTITVTAERALTIMNIIKNKMKK